MTIGYQLSAPMVVPPSGTLAVDPNFPPSYENQQVRVDVMKPTAPIESIDPADILATLFATKTGDPEELSPTQLSANLPAFAGQTVRIRIANAVGDAQMNTMVDNVAIASAPIPNAISRGRLRLDKKRGAGKMAINVPGAGVLTEQSKGSPKRIKPVTLNPTAAGTVQVPLNPTKFGRKTLKQKGN